MKRLDLDKSAVLGHSRTEKVEERTIAVLFKEYLYKACLVQNVPVTELLGADDYFVCRNPLQIGVNSTLIGPVLEPHANIKFLTWRPSD